MTDKGNTPPKATDAIEAALIAMYGSGYGRHDDAVVTRVAAGVLAAIQWTLTGK